MDQNYSEHYSVMLRDCLRIFGEELDVNSTSPIADMTFGAGGHTLALAKEFSTSEVYSVDQDPEAFANGQRLIKEGGLEDRVHLIHTNFTNFPAWWSENKSNKPLKGAMMDLGVSSHHFDSFERGFSFREDAPLDMRMNNSDDSIPTAADILNTYSEEDIANIIFEYGEERLSRRIAKKIVETRAEAPIKTTKELENICFHAYPANMRHRRPHPATRTFQALRIYVNAELKVLSDTLPKLYELLEPGGVLIVISFHSLEDRIVKRTFKEIFQTDKNAAKILTKRPLTPSELELEENPRSRSAKLRAIKKLDPGGVEFGGKKEKKNKQARRK
ncbi:MAG: 16S rRNA (cytosine(1402)-N(4))-methyltransferase [Halobacteriovoraceae bacterium]|nr:16S rRNA (cytosine(1402)-N(4))-methyltransferase [Halobacteriovoraceae bacterium]|tara:strand:+ start:49460 stop:50452 length:993 start_codon:yes stop_codon:yes gene_type:complete